MDADDHGRFANAKIFSGSARFLPDEQEARAIVSDMSERVRATWYDVVRAQGVSEKDAETNRGAFLYEGFSR
jgi:serine/threonine-protein kinase HipA